MKHNFLLLITFLACTLPAAAGTQPERTSTIAQRRSVNITVYNGGAALIHDRRRVPVVTGLNRIAWRDVSAQMDPTTVLVQNGDSSNRIDVLEQNFDYDLLNPSALLNRYVGREVTVVHPARFSGEHDTRERARLLSTNGGEIVLQYRDRIETQLRGYIVYPAAPKNFRDRPTLQLTLNSGKQASPLLDLSYLTSGLGWRADYVGLLSPDGKQMTLNGSVTLSNTSGETYRNARLQLVAGNVNLSEPQAAAGQLRTIAEVRAGTTADVFASENYFEYHLYTLKRPTTIENNQTKQVSLFSAHDVPVRKTLELRGSPNYYQSPQGDLGDRLPVSVYVTFENRGGDLGIPLPAGIVRLYQSDTRSVSQFLGSDSIDHTPKGDTVRLHLGDSFDVTARKRQTDYEQSGGCRSQSSYEIVLGNAKDASQDVLVVETLPGDWRIRQENLPHSKTSSSTATWSMTVPAQGHATLTYTAGVRWC